MFLVKKLSKGCLIETKYFNSKEIAEIYYIKLVEDKYDAVIEKIKTSDNEIIHFDKMKIGDQIRINGIARTITGIVLNENEKDIVYLDYTVFYVDTIRKELVMRYL